MKIYIISGEKSGDIYGGSLITSIKKLSPESIFRGCGGDKMRESGLEIVKHIRDFSFMGFLDVICNLRKINYILSFCKKDIIQFNPDVIILIDFPGFNMRIAKFAKKIGIKVLYYIPPKLWAWNKKRIHKIKKYVDEIIVIFPFEVKFYKKFNINARYFGNPLYEQLTRDIEKISRSKPIISILPGSRKQEVKRNLPIMTSVTNSYPDYHFIIATTNEMEVICKKIIEGKKNIELVVDKTYSVLKSSKLSIITSGTATLEAGLLQIPQIVCYKTDYITYYLAKLFIKIKWISLVNILNNKKVVKELIQFNFNEASLKKEINILLSEKQSVKLIDEYKELISSLKSKKNSKDLANFILNQF